MSRKLNYSTRNFSEPIILIRFKSTKISGIPTLEKQKDIKMFASVMHINSANNSSSERNINFEVSIVIPSPPFQLNILNDRIIVNNQQFIISKLDYNFLWRESLKITCIYEKEYIESDSTLKTKIGDIING